MPHGDSRESAGPFCCLSAITTLAARAGNQCTGFCESLRAFPRFAQVRAAPAVLVAGRCSLDLLKCRLASYQRRPNDLLIPFLSDRDRDTLSRHRPVGSRDETT